MIILVNSVKHANDSGYVSLIRDIFVHVNCTKTKKNVAIHSYMYIDIRREIEAILLLEELNEHAN